MIVISTVISILITVLVFGVIILVHELGHFIAARATGIKVNEFAMGMGPKLFSIHGKETLYSLRAFPVGGFCAMEGEDTGSEDERSFGKKKLWQRFVVLFAGAAMNLVLGYVLLLVYCGAHTNLPVANSQKVYYSTTIAAFEENAVSEQSGLKKGDEILNINGKGVLNFFEALNIMQADEDGVMSMTVRRTADGKSQKISLEGVTLSRKTDESTGETSPYLDFKILALDKTILTTLSEAGKMELAVGRLIWRSLVDMVTGKYGLNDLSGPVGVVGAVSDVVQSTPAFGWQQISMILMLTIMLTVNVGIFNLLPLPALDGGRIIFLLYELIARKPLNPKYEGVIHAVGFALFMLLMVAVTFKDVYQLIAG